MPHDRDVSPEQLSQYFREDLKTFILPNTQDEKLRIEDRRMWAYVAEVVSKTADQLDLQTRARGEP